MGWNRLTGLMDAILTRNILIHMAVTIVYFLTAVDNIHYQRSANDDSDRQQCPEQMGTDELMTMF